MKLVKTLRHKTGGSGFDFRWGPCKFLTDLSFLSAFSNPTVHTASNRYELQRISLGGKVRAAGTADNSAVLLPNITVHIEAQHSINPLSLHEFLLGSFTLYSIK